MSSFHSLFRVLFIVRSRYLFAIGLRLIFCNKKPQKATTFRFALHSQATRLVERAVRGVANIPHQSKPTGLSPSAVAHSSALGIVGDIGHALVPSIHLLPCDRQDSHPGLFPLHSPLLGESLLFSFTSAD